MNDPFIKLTSQRRCVLSQAAEDFFFFQNRNYPRSSAIQWVGDRYTLSEGERHLLLRGVFAQRQAITRRAKRCRGSDWCDDFLFVDGHNIQITVESGILGRTLLWGNDKALRDVAGQSARFKLSEVSEAAIDLICGFLSKFRPRQVIFLFDAPMSHSGMMAARYRQRLKSIGLVGDAQAAPVPEREIPHGECVVASSDGAVLDKATRWLDLAYAVLLTSDMLRLEMDFSSLVLTRGKGFHFPGEPHFGDRLGQSSNQHPLVKKDELC